jgi:hypothetical protein
MTMTISYHIEGERWKRLPIKPSKFRMGQDKNLGISESGKLFYFSGKQLTNQVFHLDNPRYAKLPQYPLVSRFMGQK